MRKTAIFLCLILFILPFVFASEVSDARQNWVDIKAENKKLVQAHQQAKQKWHGNKSDEYNQNIVNTGKDVLNGALDEAEAWLMWKKVEAQNNNFVSNELKNRVQDDVDTNLAKIDELRTEVNGVETQLQLGITWLRMIGKYLELLTDVSRNSGLAWVEVANAHADRLDNYEGKLRAAAESMDNNAEILNKLDLVRDEIDSAKNNIDNANLVYEQVVVGGTPLIKFNEGNQYMRTARLSMMNANVNLRQAFNMVVQA